MKKIFFILILLVASILTQSCEDYLEREPQDFLSEESYFTRPSDLELFVNKFYSSFDVNQQYGQNSRYATDRNSDDLIGPFEEINLLEGYKLVPSSAGNGLDDWNFSNIRETNYFIETIDKRIATDALDAEDALVNQYRGENYFFRAWFYFNKLQAFGDFPIVTEVLPDDLETLVLASEREPRNEVARFILKDLDQSIELLQDGGSKNRISKSAAQLLASRVALHEGTWLKYHQGTARVPGGPDWPGTTQHPDFSFPLGSIASEVDFFLEKAMEYADNVAGKHSLYDNYREMFISQDLESVDGVLFYKSYGIENVLGHGATHYLQRTGGGIGFTRSLVESYLMENGLPIYAAGSEYEGDATLEEVVANRDNRLKASVLAEGDTRIENPDGSITFFDYPALSTGSGWQSVTSGYQLEKWMSTDPAQAASPTAGTTQTPIFRIAEAYLNYIEASYEREGALNGKVITYWKSLRERAGVDTEIQRTISNTNLNNERDLAVYSAGMRVDATLYNIRRERRNEFIAEGMRLMDMYRWRAFDTMENYVVEGFNLWEQYDDQYGSEIEQGENVSYSPENGGSTYLQPFRIRNSNRAYDGYSFPEAHYLNPLPLDQFILTNSADSDGVLYQNPGWSNRSAIPAEY